MIQIIPAIDLIDGHCVRLTQGEFTSKKTYNSNPLDVALRFEGAGIKRLHLVDLDGARQGRIINYKTLEKIAAKTALSIDFGGGVRSDKDLEIAFECGANQVSAGSIAAERKDMFLSWLGRYGGEKLILGADVREEKICVSGWTEEKQIYLLDFLHEYREAGVKYVICTDISKDGMLAGPAHDLYKKVLGEIEVLSLIASGGITSVDDIDQLRENGVYGAIIGKALYEGKISLADLTKYLC